MCTWDKLVADCLAPDCPQTLVTVFVIIGLIFVVGFMVGFIIYVYRRKKPSYSQVQ